MNTYDGWNARGYKIKKGEHGVRRLGKVYFSSSQVEPANRIPNGTPNRTPQFDDDYSHNSGNSRFRNYHESQFDGERGDYYTSVERTHTGSTITVDYYKDGRSTVHWGGPCGSTDYDEFGEEC